MPSKGCWLQVPCSYFHYLIFTSSSICQEWKWDGYNPICLLKEVSLWTWPFILFGKIICDRNKSLNTLSWKKIIVFIYCFILFNFVLGAWKWVRGVREPKRWEMSQKSWTCMRTGKVGGSREETHHPGTAKQWLKPRNILWILKMLVVKHVTQIPRFDTPINAFIEFALLIRTFCMNGCSLGNSTRSSILHL